MFCNVKPDCVIENITLPVLYEAPLMLEKSNLSGIVCRELGLETPKPELTEWIQMVEKIRNSSKHVKMCIRDRCIPRRNLKRNGQSIPMLSRLPKSPCFTGRFFRNTIRGRVR